MSPTPLTKQVCNLLLVVFLYSFIGRAQDVTFIIPDSLKSTPYDELLSRYAKVYRDTLKSKIYLNTYYKRAILDDDDLKKAKALGHISYYLEKHEEQSEVINLAIHHAKISGDKYSIIQMYTLAGSYHLSISSYDKALNFYFKSLILAEEIQNEDYIYINKHNIAIIKGDIGNYKESLKLFKECYEREVKVGDKSFLYDYLSSTLYLSESFIRNKQLDSANFYLKKVLLKTREEYPDITKQALVYKSIAGNKNTFEDYENLSSVLDKLETQGPNVNRTLVIGNYYAGLMSEKLGYEKSSKHFQKVDLLHHNNGIYIPEVRFSLESLIKYYKREAEPKKQLNYVDKLLKFDSIYNTQKDALGAKIFMNYDTPILLSEKEQLIKSLDNQNTTLSYSTGLLFTLATSLLIIVTFLFKRNKKLKSRFEKIVSETKNSTNIPEIKQPLEQKQERKELTISSAIVEEVLNNLSKFESKKGFTNKNLTASSIAKKIGTNNKYLSQIINYHKNKSVSNYINDLRIEYSIDLLKLDRKMLNYTIQSIAEEVGFNNAESFSKAFFKNTGIKPSYFIKKLRNN